MTQIPEKIVGGEASTQEVLNFLTDKFNNLIDHLTARQELEDKRYKELTSRIDTIAGDQLEMKRGKRCPEEDFGFEPKDQPKRWRAEDSDNDGYWYINDWGDSMYAADNRDDRHNFRYNTGNYHPTHEIAEAYKAKLLSDNAQ